MARFLSREWFDEVAGPLPHDEHSDVPPGPPDLLNPPGPPKPPDLVVEIVVSGTPEGDVRYQVVVAGEDARVLSQKARFWPAHLELTSDYTTMAGIASGRLSALDALSAGQARVSGDIGSLSSQQPSLAKLDLLPPAVRTSTTF